MSATTSKSDHLEKRLIAFAAIVSLSSKLPRTPQGRHICGQILRSGTRVSRQLWRGAGGGREWERNREAVQTKAIQFLAEEFASLRTRTISAEKLGMAEVTYPGLASLGLPPGLL